jgi:hypothetical protein
MSKVTAPFFGFHASQQINKALVYFVWKGINCVRTWVIPANPKTALQIAQRGNFTALVTIWHGGLFSARDVGSWNRAATAVKFKPQSGFNRFIGIFRNLFYSGISGTHLSTATDTSTVAAMWQTSMAADQFAGTNICTKNWGTKPTSLIYTDTPVYMLGTWTSSVINTGLTAGAKVYWKYTIVDGVAAQGGESGINTTILT